MTAARRGESGGFTLLETLLALTLLSVMLLILYTGLRTTLNAESAVEESVGAAERVRTAQTLLRSQISIAVAVPLDSGRPTPVAPFAGNERGVAFVGTLPDPIDDGRFHVQTFEFVDDGSGVALVYRHSPASDAPDGPRARAMDDRIVLLDGLESGAFEYLSGPGLLAPATWVEEWRGWDRLPLLIQVRVTPRADTPLRWPPLSVRLRHYDPNR